MTQRGPLEEGMANHTSVLALRNHEPREKALLE